MFASTPECRGAVATACAAVQGLKVFADSDAVSRPAAPFSRASRVKMSAFHLLRCDTCMGVVWFQLFSHWVLASARNAGNHAKMNGGTLCAGIKCGVVK